MRKRKYSRRYSRIRKKYANKHKIVDKIKESPINYFSDLFIVAIVVFWIFDNIYQSIIASIVTISSVVISLKTGTMSYDTSMWSSIGTNVAIPLSCGGAIWMIKNSVQHAIANKRGENPQADFPEVSGASNDELHMEELFDMDDYSSSSDN